MSELTADQVCCDLAPAPWPSSGPLLSLAVELPPGIEDKRIAALVEELAILVTERDEQVAAMRSVLSVALNLLHRERATNERLRAELYRLRDEYHGLRATRSQEATLAVPNSVRTFLHTPRKSRTEEEKYREEKYREGQGRQGHGNAKQSRARQSRRTGTATT